MTFDTAASTYLQEHVTTLRQSTVASYQQSLRVLGDAFGDLYLSEVTRRRIAEFETQELRRVSPSKVKHYRAALSGIFQAALKYDWIELNPCRSLPPIKIDNARFRFLTPGEWETLYTALPHPIASIAGVSVTRGMRLGEILALTWRDLDFQRDEIHITDSKNTQPRVIPMEDSIAHFPAQRGMPKNPVFQTQTGEHHRVDDISRRFARAAKKAGLSDVKFHDLRHTFASWYVQAGGDLYRLQRILGHKGPAMTQRYAHLRSEDLRTKTGTVPRDFLN